jgi:hypothetical protein
MLYGKRVEISQDARAAPFRRTPMGALDGTKLGDMPPVDADKSVNEVITRTVGENYLARRRKTKR